MLNAVLEGDRMLHVVRLSVNLAECQGVPIIRKRKKVFVKV